jgi:hypothetical protein
VYSGVMSSANRCIHKINVFLHHYRMLCENRFYPTGFYGHLSTESRYDLLVDGFSSVSNTVGLKCAAEAN